MDSQKLTLFNRIKDSDIYFSFIKSPTAIVSTFILIVIFFCSFFVENDERILACFFTKMYDENKKLLPERQKLYDDLKEKYDGLIRWD